MKLLAMDKAAIKQAGETKDSWWPYDFQRVSNGIKVVGDSYRLAKKGIRKGEPIPTGENRKTVFITREMISAEVDDD
jgi:hypothetical protein